MTSGISIMAPSLDELMKYKLNHQVGVDEKPLWLGSPSMKYAFTLGSPATFLFMMIFAAFWLIKIHFEYTSDFRVKRAIIAFGLIFISFLIVDLLLIRSLKKVLYLITSKNINIIIQHAWYVRLNYYTRSTLANHPNHVLKYELKRIKTFEIRKSLLNRRIGNIYLENSVSSVGVISAQDLRFRPKVTHRIRRFPIQISTQLTLANVMYSLNDVASVSELLSDAINKSISKEY